MIDIKLSHISQTQIYFFRAPRHPEMNSTEYKVYINTSIGLPENNVFLTK